MRGLKTLCVCAIFLCIGNVQKSEANLKEEDERISKLFMENVDPKQIEKYLEDLAHSMHRAGTQESLDVADYIKTRFVDFGLKPVETEEYDVLLSYPDPDKPDQITLLDNNGMEVTISEGNSTILEDSESTSKHADLQFLAFGKPGSATSKSLVYANYGRLDDFLYLLEQGVNLNDSIALIRYGWLWRGTKVRLAEQFGLAGVILYSDPADYHGDDKQLSNDTFPHNDHLPPTDGQRGAVVAEDNGDILTPLLPAKDYVKRKSVESVEEEKQLPGIPATVIGFGDVLKLLQEMDGIKAPHFWQGGLPVVYTLGGHFKTASRIRITVGGHLERKKIRNVIGYIKGSVEPDRYVILGNHHDAWTYGALDPSSGTAALLEAARAFGVLVNQKNWTPRRTLVFCAWDAEEYGLIGSTEWVEQNLARLQSQAVAYLNVDTAVTGHYAVYARGMPSLKEALYEAARRTPNPNQDELKAGIKTVYGSWRKASGIDQPRVETLVGSGSDYKAFLHYAGVPIMDIRYGSFDRTYPLYHTLHDTVFLVKQFTDPTFTYHQAVSRLWGEFARLLADSPLVPFNLDDYTRELKDHYTMFEKRLAQTPYAFSVDMSPIVGGLDAFRQAAHTFAGKMRAMSSDLVWSSDVEKRYGELRMMNDRLVMLERFFIEPRGTPYRPSIRHTLFGPGIIDSYIGVLFPGVEAALEFSQRSNFKAHDKAERSVNSDREAEVEEQISWVAYCLHAASDWLNRDF